MNPEILNTESQEFINANLFTETSKILLKGIKIEGVTTREIIEQIEAKVKCKKKLPTWYDAKNIYFPNKLNIEQTSSEITAQYKSQLLSGDTIADLTGGFGVDSFYFSKNFKQVAHYEIDPSLSEIVAHNNNQFGLKNIKNLVGNGIASVLTSQIHYDWMYIDPSRRHESKGKVFFLKDCLPDVPRHLNVLFEKTENIAIKTSPLLDISAGIKELKYVKSVHIVAVKNEVKELIWLLKKGFDGEITIETVNITADAKDTFCFKLIEESQAFSTYESPLHFLYEPNTAILKAGGFNCLASQFKLSKLHQHSHLYTSNEHIEFPGRRFKIETVIPYNNKALKALKISNANITTRNFPESVQQLRKKLSIKDGGRTYIFFTTNYRNEKIVVICSKI